jgi:hypothetical protein
MVITSHAHGLTQMHQLSQFEASSPDHTPDFRTGSVRHLWLSFPASPHIPLTSCSLPHTSSASSWFQSMHQVTKAESWQSPESHPCLRPLHIHNFQARSCQYSICNVPQSQIWVARSFFHLDCWNTPDPSPPSHSHFLRTMAQGAARVHFLMHTADSVLKVFLWLPIICVWTDIQDP